MKKIEDLLDATLPSVVARREASPRIEPVVLEEGGPIQRAGDYLLSDVIGEGGFGVVYRAVHAARGTPAAVKIMHPDLVTESDLLMRFEREVEAIQRIRHPGVVSILDCGKLDNGTPYFVMELLVGCTLEQRLHAHGRLPADEALTILEPLCDALGAAHAMGIVHRDIKPSNVFLCDEAEPRRVVLLDFGVAKLFDAPGPALTSSRYLLGTPAFMSPEQLLNKPVDARTDIYALACLLYAMLTGASAFQSSAFFMLRQMHLHHTPERASVRAPVGPAFDEVLIRAMSKDPAARQPNVNAFLDEVRAAVERALRAGAAPDTLGGRRAIGLHIEVTADAQALESPSESFLADFESILPLAIGGLSAAGFTPASITGTSALLTTPLPSDVRDGERARGNAVSAAASLNRRLLARDGRNPRVRVRLCLHVGEVLGAENGALVGGELLDLSTWIPEGMQEGVHASPAVVAGLDVVRRPGSPPSPGAIPLLWLP